MKATQTNLFDKETPSQYFNTTHQAGNDLKTKVSKAKSQAEDILDTFKRWDKWYTPWDIYQIYHGVMPITSIRARITVLEQNKSLIKSESTVKSGPYNTPCYQWKFNPQSK